MEPTLLTEKINFCGDLLADYRQPEFAEFFYQLATHEVHSREFFEQLRSPNLWKGILDCALGTAVYGFERLQVDEKKFQAAINDMALWAIQNDPKNRHALWWVEERRLLD